MIQRKGRATKWDKIQTAIKPATTIQEVYAILEQFRLTSAEDREIARMWANEQEILKCHEKGAYASSCVAEVA